jgi:transcriptional regulator NrdR family protein
LQRAAGLAPRRRREFTKCARVTGFHGAERRTIALVGAANAQEKLEQSAHRHEQMAWLAADAYKLGVKVALD